MKLDVYINKNKCLYDYNIHTANKKLVCKKAF